MESLARDIARLESPSKAIRLKATEKVVDIILADRVINKNAVNAILLKAWSSTAKRGPDSDNIFLFGTRVLELGHGILKGSL